MTSIFTRSGSLISGYVAGMTAVLFIISLFNGEKTVPTPHLQETHDPVMASIPSENTSMNLMAKAAVAPDCPPSSVVNPYIGGTVFLDYGQDGQLDAGIDQPIAGVTVTVYGATNNMIASATSSADGDYLIEHANIVAGAPHRVEFTNIPAEYKESFGGSDNGTSVQFANGNSCNVNYGLMDPLLYCQGDPKFVMNCYIEGDNVNQSGDVLISIDYNVSPGNESNDPSLVDHEAVSDVIGTTFGLAYQRHSGNLFAAAYMKRFSGFGPDGPGAIYRIFTPDDGNLSGVLFVDLNDLFNSNVAGADIHDFNTTTSGGDIIDEAAFNGVGRYAFGDIDISEDELTLYAINMNDRSLYAIPLGTDPANPVAPTSSAQVTVTELANAGSPLPNLPSGINNDEIIPMALKVWNGKIYIGLVTNGQSGGSLRGLVYSFDPGANTFVKELDFDLTYNRGCGFGNDPTCYGSANWNAWINANVYPASPAVSGEGEEGHPQPMISDIEFDAAGNMILGMRDRFGDQSGFDAPQPNSPHSLRRGDAFGDVLKANKSGSGWTINTSDFADPSNSINTSENLFGGDDYFDGGSYYHEETTMGGLAVIYPDNGLVTPSMDPRTAAFSNGIDWYNLSGSGLPQFKALTVLLGSGGGDFGKAYGLGEMEFICDLPPLEIGNKVWLDGNGNGIQDPGEAGIANVPLNLYTDTNNDGNPDALIGTTTTNNEGCWFFNPSNINQGGVDELEKGAKYVVQIASGAWSGGVGTGPLASLELSPKDASLAATGDLHDSDAMLTSNIPSIALMAGMDDGESNHSYDFGFQPQPTCELSVVDVSNPDCSGGPNYDMSLDLSWTDGPTTGDFEVVMNGGGSPVTITRTNMNATGTETVTMIGLTCSTPVTDLVIYFEDDPTCSADLIFLPSPIDPAGYTYCVETGEVITGGMITVTGPDDVNNPAIIMENGTNGTYAWAVTVPGTYTMVYTPPGGYNTVGIPGDWPGDTDDILDPTVGSEDNPLPGMDPMFLGSDATGGFLDDPSPAANPFFLVFDLNVGDPNGFLNNIPLQGCPLDLCDDPSEVPFVWGDYDELNQDGNTSYPDTTVLEGVSGTNLDVTVVVPEAGQDDNRVGAQCGPSCEFPFLENFTSKTDVYRYFRQNDDDKVTLTFDFSEPTYIDTFVSGGQRPPGSNPNAVAYGVLTFWDGPGGTGNKVISQRADPGERSFHPETGGPTTAINILTSGPNVMPSNAFLSTTNDYVFIGYESGQPRPWGVLLMDSVPVRSITWCLYVSTVDVSPDISGGVHPDDEYGNNSLDLSQAESNLFDSGNVSAYISSFCVNTCADVPECPLVLNAGNDASICQNTTVDLSTLGTVVSPVPPAVATWSTSGDGSFTGGTAYGSATEYVPGPGDIANGGATLTLSTAPFDNCPAGSDDVQITILRTDCGTFPWGGN